jgi:hypothetical protein
VTMRRAFYRNPCPVGHKHFSYESFAAGCVAYGIQAAALAAKEYGVPLETCIEYVRHYVRFGYVV